MEAAAKGMVTSLSSLFPAEDAQKAAKRVEEKIEEQRHEMDRLKQFITDNTNLVNLVQKLPEKLHHDIMVPFGKAAFFPGRLIHTNEFLVLLGESYYVERTSKQTVEILKRRGKSMESQVDDIKAMIQDLKAEASFFDATASEVTEGLVEIREDYVEENSTERVSESGALVKHDSRNLPRGDNNEAKVEDEEFARMMSRLDELEEEELAAEKDNNEMARDQESNAIESESGSENDENEETEANSNKLLDDNSPDHNPRYSECTGLMVLPVPKDEASHSQILPQNVELSDPHASAVPGQRVKFEAERTSAIPERRVRFEAERASAVPEPRVKFELERASAVPERLKAVPASREEEPVPKSKSGFDSSKAFTGSIIERSQNLETNAQGKNATSSQLSSGAQPSKPVSRFKMQRR